VVHENGAGADILGGAVKRDDSANDSLYIKFHVDPLSDKNTEEYFAALELFDGDIERLGVGNALKAWAYSAFLSTDHSGQSNIVAEYIDLRSAMAHFAADGTPTPYQFPQRGAGVTIVFKVQYVPGEDDLVTVWLNPDLGPGANEVYQAANLTTRFNASASFDEIRLRHGGGGGGWTFSDLAVATSFNDFVDVSSARPGGDFSGAGWSLAVNFRAWQKEHGLPQIPVRALSQTLDGYIWVGSDDGIGRFDGVRFVSFGPREGLGIGQVRTLFGDSHGALWIGSADRGLSRWHNGRVTNFRSEQGLPSNAITALAEDAEGRLWVGTAAGLVVRQEGRFAPLKAADDVKGNGITALVKEPNGAVLLSVKGIGVFRYIGQKLLPLNDSSEEQALKDTHCLLADQTGRIWISGGDDLVLCAEGETWHRYKIPRHLAKPFVSTLAEDGDGTIWAGSASGGLLRVREGRVAALPANSGLLGNLVGALLTDREGKLWVGTDSGLNRLRRKRLFALGQNEGLGFGAVHGLAEVARGVVWAIKPTDGLYRWDGRIFSRLNTAGLVPRDSQITALLAGSDGICWVAGANGLLRYKDPIAAADEAKQFPLPGHDILSLGEDRVGNLYAGTRQGKLFCLRNGEWAPRNDFAQTNAITALMALSEDSLWIGTDGAGLFRLERGTIDHIDKADGLLSDVIRALYLDTQGVLWIGTAGGGLSRWRDGRLANFTTREGLPDNTISQILEDDAGRLWLGTSGGIACVSKRGLDDFAAGKTPAVYSQLFGRTEGMLAEECVGGFHPAGLKTASGQLWFSTVKGAVVVEPRAQPTNAAPPSVVLEEVLVDGVPSSNSTTPKVEAHQGTAGAGDETRPLRIRPGRHQLELRYTGLSFDAPELLRFRYRLEGLDPDWIDAGQRRSALYSYVPPGDYHFRVLACNADGVWTANTTELSLAVLRHFWQTWWFIGLSAAGVLISVGAAIRFVEKRKLHKHLERLEEERALERERTRIAQDLHDEMGAKLCRISFLSEHARQADLKPAELQNQIASISAASRDVLQSLDEIVWAVNPRNDTVEHVASYIGQYAEEYFRMTGIECELNIPAQFPGCALSSQIRHHLFLAMHEALTNILKHSEATRVEISMNCSATALEVAASDNGKGFDCPELQQNGHDSGAASGEGLRNMYQRLVDIGGLCVIQSAPGRGTRIRFVLPVDGATPQPQAKL
jgi:ligand-binding sensor domain-containing protein/signal transduction histidine kinase